MNDPLGKLIFISGVPGAGKSTTAEAIADELQPSVLISTDELRHNVRPAIKPWIEPGGAEQLRLAVESSCAIARIYAGNSFNVVMEDVLTSQKFESYRSVIDDLQGLTVLLQPPLETVLARNAAREKPVPEERIRYLFERFRPEQFSLIIDNSHKTISEVVQEILAAM